MKFVFYKFAEALRELFDVTGGPAARVVNKVAVVARDRNSPFAQSFGPGLLQEVSRRDFAVGYSLFWNFPQ